MRQVRLHCVHPVIPLRTESSLFLPCWALRVLRSNDVCGQRLLTLFNERRLKLHHQRLHYELKAVDGRGS